MSLCMEQINELWMGSELGRNASLQRKIYHHSADLFLSSLKIIRLHEVLCCNALYGRRSRDIVRGSGDPTEHSRKAMAIE